MSLRILGGALRNRLLKSPKGIKTRPTLAIMRKATFDIVQFKIEGAQFLDLFAGSGAMGIEALSRGAAFSTFVDQDRSAVHCLKDNLQLLHLEDKTQLLSSDIWHALRYLLKKKASFDIIYIDPPYKMSQNTPLLQELLTFIDTHRLLNTKGALFIEESTPPTLPSDSLSLKALSYIDSRTFSHSILHQYQASY